MTAPTLLTVAEVAAWLRCPQDTVRERARSGVLGHYRDGTRYLFTPDDVESYLNRNRHEPARTARPTAPRYGTSLSRGRPERRTA